MTAASEPSLLKGEINETAVRAHVCRVAEHTRVAKTLEALLEELWGSVVVLTSGEHHDVGLYTMPSGGTVTQ